MKGDNQAALKVSDADLEASIKLMGLAKTAARYKMSERQIYRRRKALQAKTGNAIVSPLGPGGTLRQPQSYPHRIPLTIPNGVVIVAGDAHYWPGKPPLMHRALLMMLKRFREERKLKAVIANGDMLDFAAISRWPLINWEKQPSVQEEIEYCQDRMAEIAQTAGRVPKLWPAGNHDLRFNLKLAERAPEFANVAGVSLKDHFPAWEACWSVLINENTIVKHRMRGGVHATHNNVLASGINTVTSHLHSAKITAYTDYRGSRWGVDCGCIADMTGPQFLYMEDGPKNWREAFAVLTFHEGELLQPELVLRHEGKDGHVVFRGEVIKVP